MIALSIALGLVGLAAVLAARDVAVRWLVAREDARALRSELDGTLAALRQTTAEALAEYVARLEAAEDHAREAADVARELRLARIGRRG